MQAYTLILLFAFLVAAIHAMPADLRELEAEKAKQPLTTTIGTSTCKITQYVLALQNTCGFESIHGLWPDPESTCTYCTQEAFSTAKLSASTLADMKKYWPTCQKNNTNEDFWSHEWSKHGTCTGMTQDAYFSKALSLFSVYSTKCSNNCYLCFTPTLTYQGVC